MSDDTVQVRFSVETRYGTYSDALYVPAADWPMSDEALAAMKQARADAWIAAITAPVTPCEDCPEVETPVQEGNG